MKDFPNFEQSSLEAVAAALGDMDEGLAGSEIGRLLVTCQMEDLNPSFTKRIRIYNASVVSLYRNGDRGAVLDFIRQSM